MSPVCYLFCSTQTTLGRRNLQILRCLPNHLPHPLPHSVKYQSNHPDSDQNTGLHWRKDRTSHHNKSANNREYDRDKDKWLDGTIQVRLSEPQDYGAQDSQEEKRVFAEAVEREKDPHIAQQDVES